MRGPHRGGVPKRSTGADCKSAGSAFAGSNPAPSTRFFWWRDAEQFGFAGGFAQVRVDQGTISCTRLILGGNPKGIFNTCMEP